MRNSLTFLTRTPVVAALLVALGVAAEFASGSTVQIWSFLLVNVLLAQSINVLTGVAGQISLGHAGFLGIGAYGSALLMKNLGLPLPLALVAGAVMGGAGGWLLSFAAGRVREFYLAMMTLGFGMIFYEVVREWTSLTGGVVGLSGVPSPSLRTLMLFGWRIDPVAYFQITLAVVAGVVWLLRNFITSPYGRAFFAIHVSEVAAGSIGVPRAATKRNAYTLSAALAGLAGGFYAHLVGYLGPETFWPAPFGRGAGDGGGRRARHADRAGAGRHRLHLPAGKAPGLRRVPVHGLRPDPAAVLRAAAARSGRSAAAAPALLQGRGGAAAPPPPVPYTATGTGPLLSAEGVSISFLGLRALDNASVTLGAGEILGLVGPNGSGKSTLVNIISGIYRPGDGVVRFDGGTLTGLPDHAVARRGVLRTFQDPRLVPSFTVRENVLLGGHRLYQQNPLAAALNLPGALREDAEMLGRAEAILAMAGLSHLADTPVRDLPYGDQRMTELSRVILANPRLVMLDEPAAGLSEGELHKLGGLIRHLKAQGVGVILIEHHMDFLNELVDRVVVLDSGKVIYQGGMAGMYRDPAVVAAYLGTETHPGESVHA
ncbi:ATP-binding cassette domain-containing protein [Azospirillum doebereinerae]|uniref:branched-chain amino acid ABC transporter ATP-binding protein/permease n=1 Tax=Azospirillum doebereinerae TaxID=92933 RepID=UPI00384C2662